MTAAEPDSFLAPELAALAARIEWLEGTVKQLRAETMHPTFYCPSRKQFEALEERVAAVEKSISLKPLPPLTQP